MLRSIVGVVTGYLIFAASGVALFQLSGKPPHGEASAPFMIGTTVYGVAFACFGGYVSAWIAGRKPMVHATAMAILLALGATVSLIAIIGKGAIWSQICALALMTPAAAAGGWLRQRVASRAEAPAAIGPSPALRR